MDNQDISQSCIKFAARLDISSVPTDVKEQAKKCLLDWLGCAIHGAQMPQADFIRNYVATMGGHKHASIIGCQEKNSAVHAALSNGYFSHILEMDDVDKKSITHPGTVVIPAALSLGEWQQSTGEDLLAAIIAGYEIMLRVGAAVTPAHYRIWHTTATAGVFGSAVTAGRMLKLDEQQMTWAFGNAGSMAAGLWEFLQDGAMSKYLHAGKAAASGVLVAYMAKLGFTGASHILEGRQGFFAGYARQDVDMNIFSDLSQRYYIEEVSFKPYPCCRHTHSAVDCAIKLKKQITLNSKEIKHIYIDTYSVAKQVAGNANPLDSRQAQFSLPYCVACSLYMGEISLDSFSETMLFDKTVRQLMDLMIVRINEKIDRVTPQAWPAQVSIEMSDGTVLSEFVEYPKGDPENSLSWSDLKAKFFSLTEGLMDEQDIIAVIHFCENLETVEQCGNILRSVNSSAKI